jgi:hypothetical protein
MHGPLASDDRFDLVERQLVLSLEYLDGIGQRVAVRRNHIPLGRLGSLHLSEQLRVKAPLELILVAHLARTLDVGRDVIVRTQLRRSLDARENVRMSHPVLVHEHAVIDGLAPLAHKRKRLAERLIRILGAHLGNVWPVRNDPTLVLVDQPLLHQLGQERIMRPPIGRVRVKIHPVRALDELIKRGLSYLSHGKSIAQN